jgi:hypothetical protein
LNIIGPGFEFGFWPLFICAPFVFVGVDLDEFGEFLFCLIFPPPPVAVVVGVCVVCVAPQMVDEIVADPSVVELTALGELIWAMWADLKWAKSWSSGKIRPQSVPPGILYGQGIWGSWPQAMAIKIFCKGCWRSCWTEALKCDEFGWIYGGTRTHSLGQRRMAYSLQGMDYWVPVPHGTWPWPGPMRRPQLRLGMEQYSVVDPAS